MRLRPGDDLREELEKLTALAPLRAGVVLSAVGSLARLALRFADRKEETVRTGKFEVARSPGLSDPTDAICISPSAMATVSRSAGTSSLAALSIPPWNWSWAMPWD